MFIRVYRKKEDKELLINLDMAWKIEVEYCDENGYSIGLARGLEDANAYKKYKIFVGNEVVQLGAKPGDDVADAIETIYRNALKGKPSNPNDGEDDE